MGHRRFGENVTALVDAANRAEVEKEAPEQTAKTGSGDETDDDVASMPPVLPLDLPEFLAEECPDYGRNHFLLAAMQAVLQFMSQCPDDKPRNEVAASRAPYMHFSI